MLPERVQRRTYGRRWMRMREAVFINEPLCRHCLQRGHIKPASQIDHITPLFAGGTDDYDNLQPLCEACHAEKSAKEVSGRPRQQKPHRYSADGYPREAGGV